MLKNFLCVLIAAVGAALLLGSCIRQDMTSADAGSLPLFSKTR
jgi:hypothetical protein